MLRGMVAIFAVVGAVVAAGVFGPQPHPLGVRSDHLGPDSGESTAEYQTRARDSLSTNDTRPHWALVSFSTESTLPQAVSVTTGGRIAQLLFRVPIPEQEPPILTVSVSAHPDAVIDSVRRSAAQALWTEYITPAATESANQLYRQNQACRCLIALVIRADPTRLRTIAGTPGIQAVQALPTDATAGHFGVTPLFQR